MSRLLTLSSPLSSLKAPGQIQPRSLFSIYLILARHSNLTITHSIFTALLALGLFGGLGYGGYLALAPPQKKVKVVPATVSEPVSVTATSAGGYQEEWIPEGHLKPATTRTTSRRKTKGGAVTSGDETSGVESGAGKRRK